MTRYREILSTKVFARSTTLEPIVSKNRSLLITEVTYDENEEQIAFIRCNHGTVKFEPVDDVRDQNYHQIERADDHECRGKDTPETSCFL